MASNAKKVPKPFFSPLAKRFAQQIHRITEVPDINRLINELHAHREKRCREIREQGMLNAYNKLKEMGVGAFIMRNPNSAAWSLPIQHSDKCEIMQFHDGRKHVGFFVRPERLKGKSAKESWIWCVMGFASSFVPWVERDPQDTAEKDRSAELIGGVNGLLTKALASLP